ncbi:MAG: ABC transporter permease [Clostridia bacterium]|nr:ABC transporter permease [Clostridia bacterium]
MKMLTLASRNAKEILRDPLNLAFGLGFPLVLLALLSAIQASIPVEMFAIGRLTPGVTVFGLSFLTLFTATIIAKDRGSALLQRLYTAPLGPADFMLGYTLPMLPMAVGQCVICYGAAMLMGLPLTVNILYAVAGILPVAALYIALGLLFGSILTDKQAGGVCGALLTNLSAWLSGIWFDLELVGGAFSAIAHVLPFVHAVEMERALLAGRMAEALPHLAWVTGWAAAVMIAAALLFLRQMRRQ